MSRTILLFLVSFLGVGAFCGGAVLILSPSGSLIGMPLSMLERSPFHSFLVPGIILFIFLGLLPLLLIIPLINKRPNALFQRLNVCTDMHWSWTFTLYAAFILIIWIQAEELFIHSIHWLHLLYIVIALVIIFLAMLPKVRAAYTNK